MVGRAGDGRKRLTCRVDQIARALGERGRHSITGGGVGGEFVVSAAQVLHGHRIKPD